MNLNDKIDELRQQPCYIVDILPITVRRDNAEQYFDIEAFYLSAHADVIYRDFADVLLKLNCYFKFSISNDNCGNWVENANPQLFYHMIMACNHEKSYLNIIMEENTMIIVNGNDLYFTVYNPTEKIKQLLSSICTAKGLFFRKAFGEDIHTFIANEFLTNKSVASFVWLVDKGREIEFTYGGKQYFVSKSNSCSYVSLWDKGYEQSFTSVEMLWQNAEICELKLQQIWHDIAIDTLL